MSDVEWSPLFEGETVLTDPAEMLWRQIHPQFVSPEGQVTSQAFKPTPQDDNRMSINQSSRATAQEAYAFYTETLRRESAGSWGVTVEELEGRARAIDDENAVTAPPPPVPPGHGVIDVRTLSENQRRKLGSRLAIKATERGKQFPK